MPEERLSAPQVVRGLIDLGGVLSPRRPLAARLDYLVMRTARLLGCDRCSLMLWDGRHFRGRHNWGNPPDIASQFPSYAAPADAPLIRRAFDTRSFVVVNDPSDYPGLRAVFDDARIDAMVLAPITDPDGDPIGFMTAEYCERSVTFTELEGEVVGGIAILVGVAMRADRDNALRRRSEDARRRLRQELIDAEERERKRISHDIHDDVLQRVTAVAHHLEIIADEFGGDEALERRLHWLHDEARATAVTLRTLVSDLLPVEVADRTLRSALAGVVDSAQAFNDVDIELHVDGDREVAEQIPSAVVRIVRQAIDNAVTHADASRIDVAVDIGDAATTLRVADDGRGFDADDFAVRGIGTYSMHERAELLDGVCSITSERGKGTTVEAVIPYRRSGDSTVIG